MPPIGQRQFSPAAARSPAVPKAGPRKEGPAGDRPPPPACTLPTAGPVPRWPGTPRRTSAGRGRWR